jgi:hypothetical protein
MMSRVIEPRAKPAAGASIAKLRALVLLAGSVRPTRLGTAIGRPLFELPLQKGTSILDAWRREAWTLGQSVEQPALPVRIMIDRSAPEVRTPAGNLTEAMAPLAVERDPFEFRGTGGVLRDLSTQYDADDLLVIANAAQVLTMPLTEIVADLAQTGGDVAVVSHEDGTVSGIMLVRCAALREIAEDGFIDMKEQALPAIARTHRVAVRHYATATGLPVRTLNDYVETLRRHHHRLAGKAFVEDPFAEEWEPSFSLVEDGGIVGAGARLHDSVVLRDGRVDAGATLVNSVVGPGGVVKGKQMVVDALVSPAAKQRGGN